MKRIMIFGLSGSGKSTLARILGEKLSIEPTHLDRLHWKEGWKENSDKSMRDKLKKVMEKDEWIIEGNYMRILGEERVNKADTVIFMDFNRFFRLWRVVKRYFQYKGKVRPDMAEGCPEKIDMEFIHWVLIEGPEKRMSYYRILGDINIAEKSVYVMKKPKDTAEFLKNIIQE